MFFPVPTTGCVSLCICRCRVPLSRFWCHFLQFRQDLRQALCGKWWFNSFFFFPPPFSPAGLRNVAVSWETATYPSWDSCLWPEAGASSAALPGFCHTLCWSSLDVPCRVLFFIIYLSQQFTGVPEWGKNCAQWSQCFFTWVTVGTWAGLKPLLKLCSGSSCWEQELQYP